MCYIRRVTYIVAARLEQIKSSSGLGCLFESGIPALAHRGNLTPGQDDDNSQCPTPHRPRVLWFNTIIWPISDDNNIKRYNNTVIY